MTGLQARQRALAKACERNANAVVRYLDIKRFYPSITVTHASRKWTEFADKGSLDPTSRLLGERLIASHGVANYEEPGTLLTGPMFSHLMGNLVLREIDVNVAPKLGCEYFRYVDDIILVGDKIEVDAAVDVLTAALDHEGFAIHQGASEKAMELTAKEWMRGKDDFVETEASALWKTFVWDLKQFTLLYPSSRVEMEAALLSEGFRIPIRDYAAAARELTHLEKVRRWVRFARRRKPSIDGIMRKARKLRSLYRKECHAAVADLPPQNRFDRRRIVSRLRYYAGRASLFATLDDLVEYTAACRELPELHFKVAVMSAVATGNVDEVLGLGTNVAQAAGQGLRATRRGATVTKTALVAVEADSLAVLVLNGVSIDGLISGPSELLKFAREGGTEELMLSQQPFVRELACLHGLGPATRHVGLLEAAFDEDEDQVFDAVELARGSGSW